MFHLTQKVDNLPAMLKEGEEAEGKNARRGWLTSPMF
jgi:hypothetical protein